MAVVSVQEMELLEHERAVGTEFEIAQKFQVETDGDPFFVYKLATGGIGISSEYVPSPDYWFHADELKWLSEFASQQEGGGK